MAKKYKIKRYKKYGAGTNSFRAKPHPLTVVLSILVVAALVFVGYSVYEPVYNFIVNGPPDRASTPEPDPPDESAPPDDGADDTPEPAPTPPDSLRMVYLPGATALDETALTAFLDALDGTEINAVLLDIKDAAGQVLFSTQNEQAVQWDAVSPSAIDLSSLVSTLEARELSLAVRMQTFRDPLAASASRDDAIRYRDGDWLWLDASADAGGKPWLNPHSDGAREYLSALALEAAEAGADLVILDTVQFPAGSGANATFGASSAGVSRGQALTSFVEDVTARLREKGVRTAIYATAISLTQEEENLVRYGGSPMDLGAEAVVLGALPYQFGGSYNFGGLTVEEPVQNPGGVTESILTYAAGAHPGESAVLIPLLQGGNEPSANAASPYTSAQINAQIDAVKASGLDEYILYCTTGSYLL